MSSMLLCSLTVPSSAHVTHPSTYSPFTFSNAIRAFRFICLMFVFNRSISLARSNASTFRFSMRRNNLLLYASRSRHSDRGLPSNVILSPLSFPDRASQSDSRISISVFFSSAFRSFSRPISASFALQSGHSTRIPQRQASCTYPDVHEVWGCSRHVYVFDSGPSSDAVSVRGAGTSRQSAPLHTRFNLPVHA